jgi:hypothetical protein
MKQNTIYGLLAASLSSVAAAGTPVLAPRASTTVTPITVTGNGMFNKVSKSCQWLLVTRSSSILPRQ